MALVVSVWLFREPLRQQIRQSATLANDAPTPEVVSDMIEHAADPRAALLAAWNSGKIVHREVAIRSLTRVLPAEQPLPPEFDSLLLSAALDPDMNVRESALGILRERHHPALAALAAEQLHDFESTRIGFAGSARHSVRAVARNATDGAHGWQEFANALFLPLPTTKE